jgi:hypothetical protein
MICRRLHGQPQCRRKVTTVGLLPGAGKLSLAVRGACSPTAGVVPTVTAAGDIHDQNSVCQVIVFDYRQYVQMKCCDMAMRNIRQTQALLYDTVFAILALTVALEASCAGVGQSR